MLNSMSFSVIYSMKMVVVQNGLLPYTIYVTEQGNRIGVIGATAEYTQLLFEARMENNTTA